MDDSTLVQRATEGDTEALAAIYDRYAGPIHDFLWWVLQDRGQADAALVDTFAIAGSRVGELADATKLRSWLFAIAAREALHGQRPEAEPGQDDEAVEGGEFVPLVRATAEQLTPQERAVLDLRFRHGFEGQELGDAVGVRAEYADTLVGQMTDRVDRSLGPMLSTRFSRKQCVVLNGLIAEQELPLDERTQRQVAEHTENCQICADWRRRVGIATVLAVAPTLSLPPSLGARVLEETELGDQAQTGRHWLRRRSGFPRPLVADRDRRRLAAAAAALVVLVGAGAFALTRDNSSQEVASVGATTTTTRRPASSTIATSTTIPATSTTIDATAGASEGAGAGAGTTGTSPGGTTGATSGGGGGGSGAGSGVRTGAGGSSSTPEPEPGAAEPSTPAESNTTVPPTTAAPDTTKPSLSNLRVSPSVLRGGGECASSAATQATITVDASDASGLASVTATAAVPQHSPVAMTPSGGGTYTATIGPFTSPLPFGQEFATKIIVQAVDASPNANTEAITADITLRC